MIPNTTPRVVHVADTDSARFGISDADSVHIQTILRDTLYSDKVLAVVREYSANAWDAHREAGIGDRPIEVALPTQAEPVFSVHDRGAGLSPDRVFRHFTQYGDSSKRASNDGVGYLGIGCKSGFAYADSFTVTSWHGGRKRVYAAVLDASGAGEMRLLCEEDCGDETGLQVSIPVRPADRFEFIDKAAAFYQHFEPQPVCNYALPTPNWGMRRPGTGKLYAVMGCIAYPIERAQLVTSVSLDDKFGAFRFDIGALDVAASREALKYSERTRAALTAALTKAYAEVVAQVEAKAAEAPTDWDRRLAWQAGVGFVHNRWTDHHVELPRSDVYSFKRDYSGRTAVVRGVTVRPQTRLVLRDVPRRVALSHGDIVVHSAMDATALRVAALDADLASYALRGIPIILASSLPKPATKPRTVTSRPRASSPHPTSARMFRLIGDPRANKHAAWEPVKRQPEAGDVYVVLSGFVNKDLQQTYAEVAALHKAIELPMPVIYGYRGKAAAAKAMGTPYGAWRTGLAKRLVETCDRARKLRDDAAYDLLNLSVVRDLNPLPVGHPVRTLMERIVQVEGDKLPVSRLLLEAVPTDQPDEDVKAILQRWPLLDIPQRMSDIFNSRLRQAWLDYITR